MTIRCAVGLMLLGCATYAATWEQRIGLYCERAGIGGVRYGDNAYVSLEPSGPVLVWRVEGAAAPTIEALPSEAETDAALAAQPEVNSRPIEAPALVLISQTNGTGYAVEAADDGTLYVYQYHASPIDPAQIAVNRAAAREGDSTIRRDLRALKAVVNTNIDETQAIATDLTTAAAQQEQIRALRKELIDANQSIRELLRLVRAAYRESN